MKQRLMQEEKTAYPKGIKWTKQRKEVYHVLQKATEPLSAVQIYNRIEKENEYTGYAISTIYRSLTAFEQVGFVRKTTWMGDGTIVYEWNQGTHTHYAICLGCHKREALPSCPFEHIKIESDIKTFTVTGHKLELYGYCNQCKEKSNLRKTRF